MLSPFGFAGLRLLPGIPAATFQTRAKHSLWIGLHGFAAAGILLFLGQSSIGTLVQLAMVVSVRDHTPVLGWMNLQVIQGRPGSGRTAGWAPLCSTVRGPGLPGSCGSCCSSPSLASNRPLGHGFLVNAFQGLQSGQNCGSALVSIGARPLLHWLKQLTQPKRSPAHQVCGPCRTSHRASPSCTSTLPQPGAPQVGQGLADPGAQLEGQHPDRGIRVGFLVWARMSVSAGQPIAERATGLACFDPPRAVRHGAEPLLRQGFARARWGCTITAWVGKPNPVQPRASKSAPGLAGAHGRKLVQQPTKLLG